MATTVEAVSALDGWERSALAPAPRVSGAGAPTGARRLRHYVRLADGVTIGLCLLAGTVLVAGAPTGNPSVRALADAAGVAGWLLAMAGCKLYAARAIERPGEETRRLLTSSLGGVASLVLAHVLAGATDLSRQWLVATWALTLAALQLERWFARRVFHRLRVAGRLRRRVAVIGTDEGALRLLQSINRDPSSGYEVVGLIGPGGQAAGPAVLGDLEDTTQVLRTNECVGAVISSSSLAGDDVNRLVRSLGDHGFHVAVSTGFWDIDVTRLRPQEIDGQNLVYVEPTVRTGWHGCAKRAFDIVTALAGLVLTAPFIAGAALAIKVNSRGPVFFRQERLGKDGQLFRMVKLRTMYVDAEARRAELLALNESDGPLFKIKHDPRITRVGRVLRKFSIDELPQMWNVLRGEMSMVGPRPALPCEAEAWDAELRERLRVPPGITGLWQVSGRAEANFAQYKRLDLFYVDNWSLKHDVLIVLKTFAAVVSGRGAS